MAAFQRPVLLWLVDYACRPELPVPDRDAARAMIDRFSDYRLTFRDILRRLVAEDSPHVRAVQRAALEYGREYLSDQDQSDVALLGMSLAVPVGDPGRPVCTECSRDAVAGNTRCARHGGNIITPEDRAAYSQFYRDRLMATTDRAIAVLTDLMDNGRSERVRLDAALGLLDRSGVTSQTMTHQVVVTDADEARRMVHERLDRLRAVLSVVPAEEAPVVESTVVPEAEPLAIEGVA